MKTTKKLLDWKIKSLANFRHFPNLAMFSAFRHIRRLRRGLPSSLRINFVIFVEKLASFRHLPNLAFLSSFWSSSKGSAFEPSIYFRHFVERLENFRHFPNLAIFFSSFTSSSKGPVFEPSNKFCHFLSSRGKK